MKRKNFDCVEMKREGARRVRERLKGMSLEEQLAYWDRRTEELLELQERLRKQTAIK